MKQHFEIKVFGDSEAKRNWDRENLIPSKVKLCDGLMLGIGRFLSFTDDKYLVTCKACLNKLKGDV
jgi:hypothetical protein